MYVQLLQFKFVKHLFPLDLTYQYGWNRTIMKYMGIWPEERKWNRPSSYVVLIPFLTMLCFVSVPQNMNLPRIAHDLNLVVENFSMANVTLTMSLMKTVAIWLNGKSKKFMIPPDKLYPILSKHTIYQNSLTEITDNCKFFSFFKHLIM